VGARADRRTTLSDRRPLEFWIAIVRVAAVAFAVLQVALTTNYPPGYEAAAWGLTGGLAVGAGVLLAYVLTRPVGAAFQLGALCFDFAVVSAYAIVFSFEAGTPTRQLFLLAIVLGAARFGMVGGLAVAVASVPVAAWFEERRSSFFHTGYRIDFVTFQAGAGLLMALLVGWLYSRLVEQRRTAEQRALEAEVLRDELGRRADLLDAANRCVRALGASLVLDEAFSAFIRELRGLVPFERMAIVLAEEGSARVIATAGAHADDVLPPGTQFELEHNVLRDVVASGRTFYRSEMDENEYTEERTLLALGLHSRVAAPLLLGTRVIGLLSLARKEPRAFEPHEVELVTLLGRLAASAVQNIRAYESERRTVEELRRLSTLRADFVSVVSHELRSPMAAVIGAARTLQSRWRELRPDQREAFLGLIGDETARLAALIGDVLDTSRIDAGTFTYRFREVDLAALVEESAAAARAGQDEVPVVTAVPPRPAHVRGDHERLRQVLGNLIDNAVKYSPAGVPVEVRVAPSDGYVAVSVRDRGPGVDPADGQLVFEKFGRAGGGDAKPGTGLGLYIARSIAEAHGGTLELASSPGNGATFTLRLPRSS
jgi:signal transduction histidine kinase